MKDIVNQSASRAAVPRLEADQTSPPFATLSFTTKEERRRGNYEVKYVACIL